MKIKLRTNNPQSNYSRELFAQRGIDDIEKFINPSTECLNDWRNLDNIDKGVDLVRDALTAQVRVALLWDADCDGITSSAIIYQYLKRLGFKDICYFFHEQKTHGLSDVWEDIAKCGCGLLIIPDASSNEGNIIKQFNFPVLVLDHHLVEDGLEFPSNMILINNQTSSNYTNKAQTGAGIAYQFCRAMDFHFENEWAHDYIDLAALGCCADVGSGLSYENQWLWQEGFSNIKNFMFQELIEKQSYSIGEEITPMSIAFYIVPLINAMIRVGTLEEKERLFLGFIDGFRQVPCNKRGGKGTLEKVATESVRECVNAKSKQTKIMETAEANLEQKIKDNGLLNNQLLIIQLDENDELPKDLNGLVATRFANKYKRPTLIMRESDGVLSGSGRGVNNSELISLKDYLSSTGLFNYVMG